MDPYLCLAWINLAYVPLDIIAGIASYQTSLPVVASGIFAHIFFAAFITSTVRDLVAPVYIIIPAVLLVVIHLSFLIAYLTHYSFDNFSILVIFHIVSYTLHVPIFAILKL